MATFTLLTWVPVLASAMGAAFIAAALAGGAENAGAGAISVVIYVVRAVALPVQVIGTVLLYYDRRVRTEALDLAVPADAVEHAPAFA
jgi:hypothetical protein